ncbi:thiamine biosynthesis enzyme [Cenarchaeum symbiosum A]|uniref:5-amino-6-(D-ribitylamino)uracil--L-tyrosine 4-hydroxyphenyl transferase n=1 Tax=Cenarchaeum symbiosum (strain A) TaxID=414004 RepID=A0RWZ6_CENSY|nr:thiamine biosynthesis enzyme [Cenarchaeum symbiosum A]
MLLFGAQGIDAHLVGMVADELRRRKNGEIATYVVNRNINFTNVCVKQCGFCAFSRDFREEEGYMLPTKEIVRRAAEARSLGATEVCIQAGLPPDMKPGLYEEICTAIKREVPDIHIHGFSPEEVLYGATTSQVTIPEYLGRLREAGVDTLPGTSAEILDQEVRDRISPGRISVKDWTAVITAAHRMGIRTTSTMMFGHVETIEQRARHIALIREIQKETGGFTEFVPLNFIFHEAPMYRMDETDSVGRGAGPSDVLMTHAVSRIMLDGYIENIQSSWVKEGPEMSQLLLRWGANDLGGTLINESISTSAGSGYGQLMQPKQFRSLARGAGRTPAERDTMYGLLRVFDEEPGGGGLDEVEDAGRFGSYFELIKADGFRYENLRRGVHRP